MKKAVKNSQRFVAVLLSLLMIVSTFALLGSVGAAKLKASAAGELTTVVACSDYQNPSGNDAGKTFVQSVVAQLKAAAGVTAADGFLCCGDYSYGYNQAAAGIASLKSAVTGIIDCNDDNSAFCQGNHDEAGAAGLAKSGDNDPSSGKYGVFVINEDDYMWYNNDEATIKRTAENLRNYLNHKLAVGFKAPIFVISHLPLHYSMRTRNDGDKQHANYIFNVLNDAGGNGLNIVFLYGHDHSNGWDDYLGGASVYLTKGDSINIAQNSRTVFRTETLAFTYMNAGFVGYYDNHNGADDTLTMTVFQFDNENIEIKRVSQSGIHNLKSKGVTNSYKNESGYSPDTSVTASPQSWAVTGDVTKTHEIEHVIPESTGGSTGGGSSSTAYTRVTSADDIVDGKKYLLIYNGSEFMQPVDAGTTDRVGFKATSTGGISMDDTITGDYAANEWTFTASGSGWKIGTDDGYITMSRNASSSSSYDAKFGTSGNVFTVGGSANAYTFSTTVSGTTVYFNKNENRSLINGYKNNPASFYLYRAPEGGAGTVSYTKVNASSLADLEDGETYVIVSTRDNTMYACSNEYTTVSGYTSTRLAGVAVTANGDVIESSTEVTACEWVYDAATSSFKATSGANAGKYLKVPESSSSAVTFSSSGVAYTYTNNQLLLSGSTYGLNLRSNYTYSGYNGGSTVYFYKKTVSSSGGETPVTNKKITSITLDTNEGTVYIGAGKAVRTGANLLVTYEDATTETIPVTVGMLLDLTGHFNAVQYTSAQGDYVGLAVYYRDNWLPNFTLHVIPKDDYPDYPEAGSVRVGKSASAPEFQNSGVAKIELTATGVPMNQGIDVVLMLDTSSSMLNNTVTTTDSNGNTVTKTRIQVLREAVANLITSFNRPNEAGVVQDIDIAIADFNGYKVTGKPLLDSNDHLTGASIRSDSNNAQVYTGSGAINANAFVPVESIASFDTSTIVTASGTNYDYAFDTVYSLVAAKEAANKANQEDRDIYVIFMSDGAPFSYNYFSSQSTSVNWNNWLQGTYATVNDVPTTSSHAYFYNGPGNSHRMADAIKGDPTQTFTVIKNDSSASYNGQQYMAQVPGLGAKMYSIGFCLAVDSAVTVESMQYVIRNIASEEKYCYFADDAAQLESAFTTIRDDIKQAATEAYFVDRMGSEYDLQRASTYVKNGQTFTLAEAPKIEVKSYTLYTNADLTNGVITDINDVGTRTGAAETLETVTFSADGAQAFSGLIDSGATNILVDGVINARTFFYNTNSAAVMIDADGDGAAERSLAPETFYWKIGIIAEKEFALSYYVYLTGTMEGERDPGAYPTNTSAILYYKNYLGNDAYKETVSPVLPWQGAVVNYEFYLVNAAGQPVNRAGTVVPFENRVMIGERLSYLIRLNTSEYNESYTLAPLSDVPDNYTLFNPAASATVTVSSGTTGTNAVVISDTASAVTTYYYESDYRFNQNGTAPNVSDYYNTHFAFGVYTTEGLSPDTVVVDYGLPVKIHPIANDKIILNGIPVNAISATFGGALNSTAYEESQFASEEQTITLAHGTAAIDPQDGRAVIYTPTDMQMSAEEVFYYEVILDGFRYYSRITVIPAANIFYEESFIDFVDGDGYAWQTVGSGREAYQSEDRPGISSVAGFDADNVYGYDPAYNDSSETYSLDRARVTTLDAGSIGKEPTASFTFCGSGFDLFSVTSNKTGAVLVKVEGLDNSFNKTYIVNTYYGYSYGQLYLDAAAKTPTATISPTSTVNGAAVNNAPLYESEYKAGSTVDIDEDETIVVVNGIVYSDKQKNGAALAYGWLVSDGEESGLYQIPVVSVPVGNSTLDYGTYKVTVTPKYAKVFDKTGDDSYKIYIDGVRIYDPAGKTVSGVIEKAYNADRENNARFIEVRDTVISANDFGTATVDGNAVAGTMFIDGISALSGASYADSVAKFSKAGPNNELYLYENQAVAFIPTVSAASFQIGMKVAKPGASSSTATVKVLNASGSIKTFTVSGAAEKYYDISSLLVLDTTTGEYSANGAIVIVNDSDTVLSLTNYKFTSKTASSTKTADYVTVDNRAYAAAVKAISRVMTTADASGVTSEWERTALKAGDTARLTINTPADIVSLTVDGKAVTNCTVNEDGSKTWVYAYVVDETDSGSHEIVVTDSKGRASEPIATEEITVAAAPQSAVISFFRMIIRKAVSFIKKLMGWRIVL